MEWDKFLKRYVWDDETTPYLVAVGRLSRRQAGYELKAYVVFLVFLFGVLAVVTLSAGAPGGRSAAMSLYAFSVVCAAVLLGMTRHAHAASYCAAAPVIALAWFYLSAERAALGAIDHALIVGFSLLWLRYALRVIKIARGYHAMPPGDGERTGRRRRGWP